MTVEKPIGSAHVWLINATEEPVDVYVNYSEQPAITDLKGLEVGTEFQVKGKDATPYGVYTFSARPKDRTTSDALASASIDFSEGRSFTAVLHHLPDRRHQMSVYENDFTPSDAPRMTVRHNARPEQLTWRIAPKEPKVEIPHDMREGTLSNGEWQVATHVVQNDYRFEVFMKDQLVAEHTDLELEHEKDTTVYIVGDPYPTAVTGTLGRFIIEQEFKLPRGAPPAARVTQPAPPYSTGDHNLPIAFECPPFELWQTNRASPLVSAVDPDGVITDISIAGINPNVGGISIPDHGVTPATSIGGQATARLEVLGDVPAGSYEITLVTNNKSLGQRSTCVLAGEVLPITIERLRRVTAEYEQAGEIEADVSAALMSSLERAEQSVDSGNLDQACQAMKDAAALVGAEKDKAIGVAAAEHLEREISAYRSSLECG